jgi:hypothetical protein
MTEIETPHDPHVSGYRLRSACARLSDWLLRACCHKRRRRAFRRLERAHVVSRAAPIEYARVHTRMLKFALRHGLPREALGQILRLLLAAPLSLVGLVPTGNTGGSNVRGLRPMPVAEDLQQINNRGQGRRR